jgi:hypothetical protein
LLPREPLELASEFFGLGGHPSLLGATNAPRSGLASVLETFRCPTKSLALLLLPARQLLQPLQCFIELLCGTLFLGPLHRLVLIA